LLSCSQYLYTLLYERGVADFGAMRSEYVLDLVFVNTSPLYIGSGRGGDVLGSSVDLSVIEGSVYVNGVVYQGPIIPGSSLKGVLRALAESIALGLGEDWLVFEAPLPSKEGGAYRCRCTGEGLSDVEKWLSREGDCSDPRVREIVDKYFDSCFASPVVRLFGSPWLASHVVVYDAYPADGERPRTDVVTRVAIDRLTGAQRPNMLYTIEAVRAGVKWLARLRVINIDLAGESREARLLRLLLRFLEQVGIHVGGRTSIGHGYLRLLVDESRARRYSLDPETGLRAEELPLRELLSVRTGSER